MDSTIIQANAEFVNGKHFQDLVDIIDSYGLDDLVSSPILREISHFIGFKDENMQNIANKAVKNQCRKSNYIISEQDKANYSDEEINLAIEIIETLKGKTTKEIEIISRIVYSLAQHNCKLL